MDDTRGSLLFINIAALLTVGGGSLLLTVLICRRYLESIFEFVDHMIQTQEPQQPQWRQPPGAIGEAIKRSFDLLVAVVFLIVVAPVMALIAVAIKMTSPGPVLFSSPHVGRFGKEFHALKFRTILMPPEETFPDSESESSAWTDPRVSSIGSFLEETDLDALPALLNVLRGDMSIVGRSMATQFTYAGLDGALQEILLSQKPGLVSLWSLSGMRWHPTSQSQLLCDMYYASHHSMLLDLAILVIAIPSVLGRVGAR